MVARRDGGSPGLPGSEPVSSALGCSSRWEAPQVCASRRPASTPLAPGPECTGRKHRTPGPAEKGQRPEGQDRRPGPQGRSVCPGQLPAWPSHIWAEVCGEHVARSFCNCVDSACVWVCRCVGVLLGPFLLLSRVARSALRQPLPSQGACALPHEARPAHLSWVNALLCCGGGGEGEDPATTRRSGQVSPVLEAAGKALQRGAGAHVGTRAQVHTRMGT